MPVLVDVNEPSQLPPQPHPQQHEQQQQQRVHCSSSTRRQPLVGIEEFTAKEKEESLSSSSSVHTNDHPDSKENYPPLNAARKRSRSTVVVAKGIESMPAQTFSIVLPLQRGDTSSKCGAASLAEVEVGVEGKSKASRSRVNKGRDISKETNRIDMDSTRGGVDSGVTNAASSDGLSQSEPVSATATATATTTTTSADMHRKPDISYSHLILHAISQSPNERLTLREIYAWIETRHPFYRDSPTGWQNSIRHNLSSSKAFIKLERVKNDHGKGCFWTLHENAHEILSASSNKKGRKSLADNDDGLLATSSLTTAAPLTPSTPTTTSTATAVRSRSTSSLPKINCKQDGSPRSDLPSPAASELYDDPKSPRPLRTMVKEVYAPSTPPSSPDYEADLEDKGVVLSNKSATSSTTDEASSASNPLETKTPMLPSSDPVPATTRRVRRPPQNLSEFVSSEDFKASFGKEFSTAGPNTPSSPKPVERKRSKTLPTVVSRERIASSGRALAKESSPSAPSTDEISPTTPTEELAALALAPSLSKKSPEDVPLHRLVSVPLSSLSHMTHLKRSRDDMLPGTTTKKWRREDQRQHRPPRGRGRSNSLQETTYERRCREGKREIVVASEDDWSSDSDDDFLCDSDLDGYYGDQQNNRSTSSSSFNKADLLLLDSSAISYGFEMTDSEYILDFNQGPLFNSVVWPEYSNLQGQEDSTTND
ncbi:hypothetical protein KI688_008077 [Linnemannia hyalina]|uniref:Fork-head domain-containing protein n=1 Tax=Linnemannia hyalina TaxID=64524 RepID=A0A9P8BVJ1_9FUNG|nr:hypothetical protein KI688_008077 [Linnemannia hyalina]